MNYALVEDGVVVATTDDPNAPTYGYIECPPEVEPNWTYTPPDTWTPPPPPVPESISPLQFRLWLIDDGSLEDVQDFLNGGLDPVTKKKNLARFEYWTEVRRDAPLIADIATELGMSSGDMDQAFIEAQYLS